MEVNGANRSSKYLPLCSVEERNSYRWIKIFGWSIPLNFFF